MEFGITLPNNQGVARMSELVELAESAEELGFNSLWVSEHLFHSTYVAERLGSRPYHEPLSLLAAVAATTSEIRLGTSVLVLPWHHPVRLAKTVSAIDDLSDGRFILGVGVAQTEDEYENLGIEFKTRGRVADDSLAAMKAIWTMDVPEYDGSHYRFSGLRVEPKPVQKPHPPIMIGGNSPAAYRRVREFGNGWHPLSLSPRQIAEARPHLPEGIAISVRVMAQIADEPWDRPVTERRTFRGTVDELDEMVEAYHEAGVTEMVIDANSPDLDATRELWTQLISGVLH